MARRQGSGCGTVVLVFVIVVLVAAFGAWRLGYADRLLGYFHIDRGQSTSSAIVERIESDQVDAFVYSTLNEDDQEKYRIMYDALLTREPRNYPDADMDDLARIRDCVLADHPDLFYVTGVRQLTTTNFVSGMVTDVTIEGQFSYSEEESARLKEQVDAVVDDCLAALPDDADDYAVAKHCYEYLALNTEYDRAAAQAAGAYSNWDGAEGDGASLGQTIVEVFIDGKAVCGGYASAYQYLLQRRGITCAYVTGQVNGGNHAWCLCLLDGQYYYVDPTWGDPQFTGDYGEASERDGIVNYDYLCITTDDLLKTHALSDLYEVPACTSDEDNYYVREDLLFDWPDAARLGALTSEALAEGSPLQVRCTDEGTYREMVDNVVASGQLASYLPTNVYRYACSDDMWSISLFES